LKEEGSSATDSVTDVTDVSPMEVGRRKREEGRRKRGEGKSKNKEGFSYLAYKPYSRQNLIIQNSILIIA
jgi:hypothetical protein